MRFWPNNVSRIVPNHFRKSFFHSLSTGLLKLQILKRRLKMVITRKPLKVRLADTKEKLDRLELQAKIEELKELRRKRLKQRR